MVSARTIIRGALTCTLPAVLLAFIPLIMVSPNHMTASALASTVAGALAAAAGSAAVLLTLRRRLREDAGVAGRRAFLVGLGAFVVTLGTRPLLPNIGLVGELGLMALSGAALSAGVFFPWVSAHAIEERAGSPSPSDSQR